MQSQRQSSQRITPFIVPAALPDFGDPLDCGADIGILRHPNDTGVVLARNKLTQQVVEVCRHSTPIMGKQDTPHALRFQQKFWIGRVQQAGLLHCPHVYVGLVKPESFGDIHIEVFIGQETRAIITRWHRHSARSASSTGPGPALVLLGA